MTIKIAYTSLMVFVLAGCATSTSSGRSQSELQASCVLPAASAVRSEATEPAVDPVSNFDTAWTIIARTHWDTTYNGVDWNAVRTELRPKAAAATTMGELRGVLTDMVSRLNQSHFSIIPRELSEGVNAASGRAQTDSSASADDRPGGIGTSLRLVGGRLTVTRVAPGSPAAAAGIRPGYELMEVGGCPIAPRLAVIPRDRDPRAVALEAYSIGTRAVAGPPGSSVEVAFLDARNRPVRLTLERQVEPGTLVRFGNLPPRMASLEWERRAERGRTVGIIRFNIWMPALSRAFDVAIDSLRGSDAIVLDLRGNPGGVGGMSMGIAGHFLDSPRLIGVMQQRGSNDLRFTANPRRVNSSNQRVTPYAGPLALVVDEISVSTTEIFVAGMQQMGRARVFGSTTAGQALPSVAQKLPNGDVLYHAIANFVSPTGVAIEGPGVTPDTPVKLNRKALLSGKDPALDAAVAWAAASARR